jgi:hypothetical protein
MMNKKTEDLATNRKEQYLEIQEIFLENFNLVTNKTNI